MTHHDNLVIGAAEYTDLADARSDFDSIKELHQQKWVGRYDAALVQKTPEGKVQVVDTHESARAEGALGGLLIGGLLGAVFPPTMLATAALGAFAGGGAGHLFKGIPRDDLEQIGQRLQAGDAAVIVVAEATPEQGLTRAFRAAERVTEKRMRADEKELEQAIQQTMAPTR